jgi:hypothetical protein
MFEDGLAAIFSFILSLKKIAIPKKVKKRLPIASSIHSFSKEIPCPKTGSGRKRQPHEVSYNI